MLENLVSNIGFPILILSQVSGATYPLVLGDFRLCGVYYVDRVFINMRNWLSKKALTFIYI